MDKLIKNPVLGAICGDMIGVPYEFLRRGVTIPRDFPLWNNNSTFSDDTVMTLAVAKWLLDRPLISSDLINCMQVLGRKYRDRGYGGNFRQWLDSNNPQPYGSWGNGSAMRVAPVGCAFYTEETTLAIAAISAGVSHNHLEGIKGAQFIAGSIWAILHKKYLDSDYTEGTAFYDYDLTRTPQEIRDSGYKFEVSCQKSVPEAVCCFLCSNSYEETIREAILLRGDTDTQAAIAGSLAAAYWGIPKEIADEGLDRLPSDLLHILESFSKMYNLELN